MNSRKDRMVTGHWWEVPWGERGERGQGSPLHIPASIPLAIAIAAPGSAASFMKGKSREPCKDIRGVFRSGGQGQPPSTAEHRLCQVPTYKSTSALLWPLPSLLPPSFLPIKLWTHQSVSFSPSSLQPHKVILLKDEKLSYLPKITRWTCGRSWDPSPACCALQAG